MFGKLLAKMSGSRTFVGIGISVLFKILAAKGVLSEDAGSAENVDQTVTLVYTGVSLVGDAIATWGRLKAEKPGVLSEAAKSTKPGPKE